VELGGRYWTTTSHTAAKVGAIRRTRRAAVLSPTDDGWSLRIGRAVVLDPRHPLHGFRDPVASMWGTTALARIAAAYPQQLLGYASDGAVPAAWNVISRVLIAVRADRTMTWNRDGSTLHPNGSPTWTTDRQATPSVPELEGEHRRLVERRGPCWLGLVDRDVPVVVPATWSKGGTVRVHTAVLQLVGVTLPGPACVTIDDSSSPRPSEKIGVILRGTATPRTNRGGFTVLAFNAATATTWSGFETRTQPAAQR
ncbi:MAG TPA: hypothetical protein PKV27_02185, partial [Ilumatobacteraceae bacterium]|nr:hypothetical protein [Ilumatobacteraceae bacterium]